MYALLNLVLDTDETRVWATAESVIELEDIARDASPDADDEPTDLAWFGDENGDLVAGFENAEWRITRA